MKRIALTPHRTRVKVIIPTVKNYGCVGTVIKIEGKDDVYVRFSDDTVCSYGIGELRPVGYVKRESEGQ